MIYALRPITNTRIGLLMIILISMLRPITKYDHLFITVIILIVANFRSISNDLHAKTNHMYQNQGAHNYSDYYSFQDVLNDYDDYFHCSDFSNDFHAKTNY